MDTPSLLVESIGYVALSMVILAFTLNSLRWVRLANMAGCVVFVAYAMLKEDNPVLFTNLLIISVHTYKLLKERRDKKAERGKISPEDHTNHPEILWEKDIHISKGTASTEELTAIFTTKVRR